ncbi:redoxin domain-containing protein [Flavobacterium sp. SM2513]|uniref:TlpA family protein disulfide reductase n=1 Tax=Flavobacterium sp. SM2513 TaxID=3424766 RepID=UPI003D7FDFB2
MRKKPLILLSFLFLLQFVSFGQIAKVGQQVPNYTFTKTLNNASKPIVLKKLKGKIIVLEFWATWCSPCIAEMRKLEELQKDFGTKIEVIAVSEEPLVRLEKFLDVTKSNLKIVSDTNHRAVFPYKVIPHALIIDQHGIVRAITNPKEITKEVITDILNNKVIELELKDDFVEVAYKMKYDTIKQVSNSDYRIYLSGYDVNKSPGISEKKNILGNINGIEVNNSSLIRLYLSLFDTTMSRLLFQDGLTMDDFPYKKENLYNFSVEVSQERELTWKELSVNFLNSNLSYKIEETIDSLICYEIKDIDKILKNSKSSNSEISFGGLIYKSKGGKLSELVKYIEDFTDIPVLDHTNLDGYFDINLQWQLEDPQTINRELKKYGLLLERSKKKLPVTILKLHRNE